MADDLTSDLCTALLALHAFSGADSTSCIRGMGKIKPITVLQKNQKHKATFVRLGNNWEVPNDLINELEDFTCKLFGKTHITKIDDLRLYMMKEKCGTEETISPHNIDVATLPPCRSSLTQHIRRVTTKSVSGKGPMSPSLRCPPYLKDMGGLW